MSSSVDAPSRVSAALGLLTSAVDELRGLDQEALSSDELLELLRGIETQQRRLVPAQHVAIGQLESRSVAFERGARDTVILLTMLLRISRFEAGRRVTAARLLSARRTLTGTLVEPQFPVVAAALAEGAISAAHAQVITKAIGTLPISVLDTPRNPDTESGDEDTGADLAGDELAGDDLAGDELAGDDLAAAATVGDWLERHLTGQARMTDPQQLDRHARQLAAALDQDGLLRDYDRRVHARSFDVHVRVDGSSTVRGELTAEATEHLLTHLDVLARPNPATTENGQGGPDGQGGPAGAAGRPVRDPRTPTQRRHDGLLAMLQRVEHARLLGACSGVTATLVLTMDAEVYATSTEQHSTGLAMTGHGYQIPAGRAKTWLGPETRAIAVLLSRTRGIEAYSTLHRLATEQQRLAVFARDRGCFAPACDTPLLWSDTHHVTDWKTTGRTSVDDLGLLCGPTHNHYQHAGWTTRMLHGRPWLIPPPWIDPQQTPVRNTYWD